MKRVEYNAIIQVLEDLKEQEKSNCEKYCKENPKGRENREIEKFSYICAILDAQQAIKNAVIVK